MLKNGKFSGIMTKNNTEVIVIESLNQEIYFRKTRKNDYLLYSTGSKLLVFDEITWDESIIESLPHQLIGDPLFELLKENHFFESGNSIPNSDNNYLLFLRILAIIFGGGDIVYNLFCITKLPFLEYDFGRENQILLLIFGVFFSLFTTIIHEGMHILFSNNVTNIGKVLRFSWKKSVATVDLTHVWLWPLFERSMAILAGPLFDSIILSCFYLISDYFFSPYITISIYIMIFRLLWQLRLTKHTDGRLLIYMLFDNPFLKNNFDNNRDSLTNKEKIVWRACRIFSTIITILLLLLLLFFIAQIVRYS